MKQQDKMVALYCRLSRDDESKGYGFSSDTADFKSLRKGCWIAIAFVR